MHSRIAVEAVIGSLPLTLRAAGSTVAIGSRAKRMMRKPMVAFQKPITDHGKVAANSTRMRKSRLSKPSGASANAVSASTPTMVAMTSVANSTRRPVIERPVPAGVRSTAIPRSVTAGPALPFRPAGGITNGRASSLWNARVVNDRSGADAEALWYVAPGRAELRREHVPAPGPGEVTVRALHGAISRGTERLVLTGHVPPSEYARMRGPNMGGDFPFPVKYGYATVGRVEEGPAELAGRVVFALHPHQSRFVLPATAVTPVPDGVPPRRAVLAANMETALNATWD